MTTRLKPEFRIAAFLAAIAALGASPSALAMPTEAGLAVDTLTPVALGALAARLQIGDVVFIRVPARPFREVAGATDSWTNHVGIVVAVGGQEPIVGESAFPLSRFTPLSRFVARSEGGRVAVTRLEGGLTGEQQIKVGAAARQRTGIFYDTGFDLHSRREFCSRYVREVMLDATGRPLGEVETFAELLGRHPGVNLSFWKLWYFGRIPWDRETVTPASVLRSPLMRQVFDGVATARDGSFSLP